MTSVPPTVVVAGCGYSGTAIAQAFKAAGARAWGTTRSVEHAMALDAVGVHACVVDVTAVDASSVRIASLRDAFGVVSVPPAPSSEPGHTARAVSWLVAQGCTRIVYLSSTAVYGASDDEVSGSTPASPTTPRGVVRRRAEEACVATCNDHGVPCALLRLPGIYGPHRTLRGRLGPEYTVPAEAVVTNRIFVDDIATAVLCLSAAERWDAAAYLACDGVPLAMQDVADQLSDILGLARPRRVPLADISPGRREFLVNSKRCVAPELHALGWRPAFTDVVEAHREAWRREAVEASGDH